MYHRVYLTLQILVCLLWLAPLGVTSAASLSLNLETQAAYTHSMEGLLTANSPQNSNHFAADPLPPEQAYRFAVVVVAPDQLHLTWHIAQGTYLYKELFNLQLDNTENVMLGKVAWPSGTIKHNAIRPDGEIGDIEFYTGILELPVPLQRNTPAATKITLIVKYQGCAEQGFCYPPITKKIVLELPAVGTLVQAPIPIYADADAQKLATQPLAEQDRLANRLSEGNLWGAIITFFGLGLLLAFTPCVFPMIPILSGIIIGQGKAITTIRAFWLSLVYVLAMALTYTLAGILAGLFGHNLQAAFQDPWIIGSFAFVFIALALAMFDLYELQLPSALQTKVSTLSNRQQGGSLLGATIMGALSALIVGPCIAPPLAGALIYIGQTGDALLGGLALFALGLGMGTPLLIIGISAGQLLPRAGVWMNAVKAVFGVLMLGVAIMLLERIVPTLVIMLLWGTLLICSAIYMGALRTDAQTTPEWSKLWQGLGIVLLIYGTMIVVGAGAGSNNLLQPLQGLWQLQGASKTSPLMFQPIKTEAELNQALATATTQSRPLLVDFYADWCISCKELEQKTFANPRVAKFLNDFMLLRADVTANDADAKALLQRLNIPGPPAIIFYDRNGHEQRYLRIVGFMPAQQFLSHLEQAMQQ